MTCHEPWLACPQPCAKRVPDWTRLMNDGKGRGRALRSHEPRGAFGGDVSRAASRHACKWYQGQAG